MDASNRRNIFDMRLAIISDLYPAYTQWLFGNVKGLRTSSYEEKHQLIMDDCFAWVSAWTNGLRPLGYEVLEIFANVEILQKSWAREKGLPWTGFGWVKEIAVAQLIDFQPDVILVTAWSAFDGTWLKHVRERCKSVRLVLGYVGSPNFDLGTLIHCDATLGCVPSFLEKLTANGLKTFHLRHAFNRRVLAALPDRYPTDSYVFCSGNIVRRGGYHYEREKLLEELVGCVPVALYCPQQGLSRAKDAVSIGLRLGLYIVAKSIRADRSGHFRERLPGVIRRAAKWLDAPVSQINTKLRLFMRPAVFGLEMFRKMRRASVTLNVHIDIAADTAANLRLFESTGVGSCLLTDWKSNLSELFELDREVVSYKSKEECLEKAKWLLEHDGQREAIALAGQKRTLKEHTFEHRALELDQIVKGLLCS